MYHTQQQSPKIYETKTEMRNQKSPLEISILVSLIREQPDRKSAKLKTAPSTITYIRTAKYVLFKCTWNILQVKLYAWL